ATAYELLHPVVGRFLGDRHIVHVALTHARGCNADQLRFALQVQDRSAAAVAHARTQTAHQLVNHRLGAALMGNAALDAFRHELVGGAAALEIELVLEIAIAAAAAHRADRPHAAILLIAATLEEDQLARALIGA